jgi:PAS domain S-box-containing protein
VAPLPKSEGLLSSFIEQVPVALAIFDTEMRYLAVSPPFLSDMAWLTSAETLAPANVIGRSLYETFPKFPGRWREINSRVLAGEKLAEHEEPVLCQDGGIEWVRWSAKPWHTTDGRVGGVVVFGEIITEQVKAKRVLADSEARFRATFENAAVGIAHVGLDGRWLRVNEALCRILDYPADELTTKSFQDITHPDDLAASVARVVQMRHGKVDRYELDKRYLRKDGAIVWGRLTVSCVRKSDGPIDYFVAVVEDITARKQAEEELHKSEERFKTSILHSPVPTILFNDREQILAISRSWLEAAGGGSAAELQRLEDWTKRAYGERSGEVLELIREIIATEPEARTDEQVLTRDGDKRIWNFVTSGLGTLSNGRRLFISVAQDVTDRRAYEDQIDILVREGQHRTKNILGLVQVIARQTAAGNPEDFLRRFTERVQALAANQNLLGRNQQQGADLEDLVRTQLAHFSDLVGSRVTVHGPKLHLNAVASQAIGLALHELATNAGKYGALSTDAGRVNVNWQVEDETYTMGWIERNGPRVQPPERRGFGTTVIESMVKRTLRGEVQLDYAPSGLEWHLTCRAADALEH